MRVKRLAVMLGAGLLGLLGVPLLAPGGAFAAPSTPMGASAGRAADNPYQIRVAWKPVTGADHYVVEVTDGVTRTVNVVPANVNAINVEAPDPCAKYLVSVGARDTADAGGTAGPMTVRSLAPGVPGGLAAARTAEDRSVVTAAWNVPLWTGHAPQFSYRTQLVRVADNMTVLDRTTTDRQATLAGVDRAQKYTLNVTTFNEFGTCLVAKATIGADKPGVPLDLTAVRDNPADLASVAAAWKPPADLAVPPTHYMINYWTPGKLTRTLRVDAPATTGRLSLDPSRSWTVRVQSFNDIDGSATLSNTITLEAVTSTTDPDTIAPTVTPIVAPAPSGGWNKGPVTVSFACADTLSGVESCTDPVQVAGEGAAQTVAGTAVDYAGNTTTKVATVNIDRTPPTITAAVSPAPGADGWSNDPVTVTFACADALSGIAVCPAPVEVPGDVATRTTVAGTATDRAGNTATTSVTVDIDRTAPTITATVVGTRNPAGWYTGPVTVHFTCADALSGIDTCPADVTVDTDGADRTVTGTATDRAGNTATATVTGIDVDTAAPTVRVLGASAGARYTLDAMPTITCQATDAVSGVAASATAKTSRGERGAYTATCAGATDTAGNAAAPTSVTYTVAPTVAALTALTNQYVAANDAPNGTGLMKSLANLLAHGRYCDYISKVAEEPAGKKPNLTAAQAAELTYWASILAPGTC